MKHLTPDNAHKSAGKAPEYADITAIKAGMDNDVLVPTVFPGELSTVFAMLDPDLVYLFKDMQSALALLEQAKKTGLNVQQALFLFESAQSAYQTRLLEVRKNSLVKKAMAQAGDCEDAVAARKHYHMLSMQERMNQQLARRREEKQAEKAEQETSQANPWLFYMALGYWMASLYNRNRSYTADMSTLQRDFSTARTA